MCTRAEVVLSDWITVNSRFLCSSGKRFCHSGWLKRYCYFVASMCAPTGCSFPEAKDLFRLLQSVDSTYDLFCAGDFRGDRMVHRRPIFCPSRRHFQFVLNTYWLWRTRLFVIKRNDSSPLSSLHQWTRIDLLRNQWDECQPKRSS